MDTYLMMLYVSLDQERAMKKLFADNGWKYCKPDLLQFTDAIGGLVASNVSKDDNSCDDSGVASPAVSKKTTVITFPSRPATRSQKSNISQPSPVKMANGKRRASDTVKNTAPGEETRVSVIKEESNDQVNDDDLNEYMEYGDEDDDFKDVDKKETQRKVRRLTLKADDRAMVDVIAKLDGTEDVELEDESMVCGGDSEINTDDEGNELNIDTMADIDSEPSKVWDVIFDALEQVDSSEKKLKVNKRSNSDRVQYQCGFCKVKFPDKKKLNKHLTDKVCRADEVEKDIAEEIADTSVRNETEQNVGQVLIEETDKIDEFIENKSSEKEDAAEVDDPDVTKEINEETGCPTKGFYECDMCKLAYKTPYNLKAHQALKHKMTFDETFDCGVCNQSYGSKHILDLHKLDKHPSTLVDEERVQCEDCEMWCDNFKAYLSHKKKKHNIIVCREVNRSHICLTCGKAFTRSDSLKNHCDIIHLGTRKRKQMPRPTERKHVCNFCGKAFLRLNNLSEHISVKHKNTAKKYKCKECGEAFLRPYSLEYHTNKVHLKTKPYKCDKCHKTYHSPINLRQHQDLCFKEEEEKEVCPYCGKRFSHKRNLTMHIEAIHSESPLTCECGFVIKWRSSIAKHKRKCILNKDNVNSEEMVGKRRGRQTIRVKTEKPESSDTNDELAEGGEMADSGFTTISTDAGVQVVSNEIAKALRDQGLLIDGAVAGTLKMEDGKTVVEDDPNVQSVYYVIMKE